MATCILVTGANQGLGHCVVQQLLIQGRDLLIYAACRDLEKAKKNIESLSTTSEAHSSNRLEAAAVDLNDDASIERAAHFIPRLDILVNNAGIYYEQDFSSPSSIRESLQQVYSTNLFGTIALTTALLPKLQESAENKSQAALQRPAIVNVSTGLSSFANITNPNSPQYHNDEVIYASSKAALNYYTVWAAKKYPDIRIVAVAPGHTSTALNNFTGRQTVQVGAQYITNAILDCKGPTGVFLEKGQVHQW